jgi:Zn-dependent M28 family amino/carboxypeptidase
MVEIGPRPAGSAELARTREYIRGELEAAGLKVSSDKFTAQTPVGPRGMENLTAELAGESADVIIISSHYDTKPYKEFRFVGANDGGSSTGALMEIARALAASGRKPRFTYWFVFFDGEEAFCQGWSQCGTQSAPDNTYGSRRYVAQLMERNETKRVRAMILLDMIGYTNLSLPRETLSTPWLVDIIWQTADELGYGAQFTDAEESVEDDHIPFLKAEIPVVDLIQLSGYRYWHTAEDTLDKISPRSLQIVGETVIASLPRIEQRLATR